MTDIVERLRNNNWSGNIADDITRWADSRSEAADTIAILRADNAALREGLREIISRGDHLGAMTAAMADVRNIARALLETAKESGL